MYRELQKEMQGEDAEPPSRRLQQHEQTQQPKQVIVPPTLEVANLQGHLLEEKNVQIHL